MVARSRCTPDSPATCRRAAAGLLLVRQPSADRKNICASKAHGNGSALIDISSLVCIIVQGNLNPSIPTQGDSVQAAASVKALVEEARNVPQAPAVAGGGGGMEAMAE